MRKEDSPMFWIYSTRLSEWSRIRIQNNVEMDTVNLNFSSNWKIFIEFTSNLVICSAAYHSGKVIAYRLRGSGFASRLWWNFSLMSNYSRYVSVFQSPLSINTFKYHVSCTDENISVSITLFFIAFFHRRPIQ